MRQRAYGPQFFSLCVPLSQLNLEPAGRRSRAPGRHHPQADLMPSLKPNQNDSQALELVRRFQVRGGGGQGGGGGLGTALCLSEAVGAVLLGYP